MIGPSIDEKLNGRTTSMTCAFNKGGGGGDEEEGGEEEQRRGEATSQLTLTQHHSNINAAVFPSSAIVDISDQQRNIQ